MKTRKEFLKGDCSFEDYYSQFVNSKVKLEVKKRIGIKRIMNSKDEDFNDIPLPLWDEIDLPLGTNNLLRQAGDYYTIAGQTCILKEAARQIKKEVKK